MSLADLLDDLRKVRVTGTPPAIRPKNWLTRDEALARLRFDIEAKNGIFRVEAGYDLPSGLRAGAVHFVTVSGCERTPGLLFLAMKVVAHQALAAYDRLTPRDISGPGGRRTRKG